LAAEAADDLQPKASVVNDLAQKVAQLMKMASENRTVGASRELLDEVWAMRDKNTILAQEVSVLQTENENLKKSFAQFQTDHTALLKQSTRASSDLADIQRELQRMTQSQPHESTEDTLVFEVSASAEETKKLEEDVRKNKADAGDLKQLQDQFSQISSDVLSALSDVSACKQSLSGLENSIAKMCEYAFIISCREVLSN
jgi:regulator of replication initiation timing